MQPTFWVSTTGMAIQMNFLYSENKNGKKKTCYGESGRDFIHQEYFQIILIKNIFCLDLCIICGLSFWLYVI